MFKIAGGRLLAPQHNFINKHWEITDKMDIKYEFFYIVCYIDLCDIHSSNTSTILNISV